MGVPVITWREANLAFVDLNVDIEMTIEIGNNAWIKYFQAFARWLAESEGFEPSDPVTQIGSLANYWFQPLTHDSARWRL
jgi:hypothetical protein